MDKRDFVCLVVLIHSSFCQTVNAEKCKAVIDDSQYCHCRTDSGYEINLTPLASKSKEPK